MEDSTLVWKQKSDGSIFVFEYEEEISEDSYDGFILPDNSREEIFVPISPKEIEEEI